LVSIDCAEANDNSEFKQELEALRTEFELMQEDYKRRISILENKLAEREMKRESESDIHKAAPVASYGGIMNPDVSAVANIKFEINDRYVDDKYRVKVDEAELAFQNYLFPGVRGDLIIAVEQEYTEDDVATDVDLEEAYISFLDLPFNLQAEMGRRLMHFGKLNPIHGHHWPFADTPLAMQRIFGHHSWYDDGISVSALIPNPFDLYLQQRAGYFNGRDLGHEGHGHLDWDGRIFMSRTNTSATLPFDENADIDLGYSMAADERIDTMLQGADFTFHYRWPLSYRKFKSQTELFFIENFDSIANIDRFGLYTLAQLTLDKNWEVGARYDYSENLEADPDYEWAITPFLSYHLTESLYLRGQYRYRQTLDGHNSENAVFLQCVWGMGPHSHRLED